MNIKSVLVLATVGITASSSGCGESSGSEGLETWADALEGVYRVDTMTHNEAACDAEGASTLADAGDHVAVFGGSDIGGTWIRTMGCADPADCRMRVAKFQAKSPVSFPFSYDFRKATDDALTGVFVTTGYSGQSAGQCTDAESTNLVLTRPADGQIRIEARSTVVDHPADSKGICWTDDTASAAAGKPCNQLVVVRATRIEAL